MSIVLTAVGVAFAAFCVWLGVRIINRRERWAKWTLAVVVGVPVLYVASFGPACWLADREIITVNSVLRLYRPVVRAESQKFPVVSHAIEWYGEIEDSRRNRTGSILAVMREVVIIEEFDNQKNAPRR